jgi:hypothetical protein
MLSALETKGGEHIPLTRANAGRSGAGCSESPRLQDPLKPGQDPVCFCQKTTPSTPTPLDAALVVPLRSADSTSPSNQESKASHSEARRNRASSTGPRAAGPGCRASHLSKLGRTMQATSEGWTVCP